MRIQEYTNNDISKKIMTSCDLLDTVPESEVIDEDVIQQLLQSNELLKRFKLIYEQLPARATLDDIKEPLLSEMKKSCSETTAIYVEIAKLYDKTYKNELSRMKENSYILHLEHNNTDRIVVLGDIHGSFHTFFRILVRLHLMNILNLTTWKLNDGYKLLFLGDVVDRGYFCLEVIVIILKLILVNNDDLLNPKVIYNRGNHEEIRINARYGLLDELRKKCSYDGTGIHFQLNYLFKYFSSAVLLKYRNGKIWFCHGGIPTNDLNINLNNPVKNITILPNNTLQEEIRWNDFHTNTNTIQNKSRGTGYIIGTKDLKTFLIKNKIKLICRGHQDNYYNSYILGNTKSTEQIELTKKSLKNLENDTIFIDNNNYVNTDRRYKGPKPTRKIVIDNIQSEQIVKYNNTNTKINPVITISTNTDIDRKLSKDSFVIFGLENLN
jgi:hypothetical protein